MNLFIIIVVSFTSGYFGACLFYSFLKFLNRNKFTTGDGTYTFPKETEYASIICVGGGGMGGSATINGITAQGQSGSSNGEGGQGGIVLTNDDGAYTRTYYNEKGELIIEEFYP